MKTVIILFALSIFCLFFCIIKFEIPKRIYFPIIFLSGVTPPNFSTARTQQAHVLLTDLLKENNCNQSDLMGRKVYHPELLEYKFQDRPILIKSTIDCSSNPIPVAVVFIRLHWSESWRRKLVCSL